MSRWNGNILLKEIDLTMDSDASLIGWGAVCLALALDNKEVLSTKI